MELTCTYWQREHTLDVVITSGLPDIITQRTNATVLELTNLQRLGALQPIMDKIKKRKIKVFTNSELCKIENICIDVCLGICDGLGQKI
jgi:hypothetical protein